MRSMLRGAVLRPFTLGAIKGQNVVKHRSFIWFILMTATTMFLFIAVPIVSVYFNRFIPRMRHLWWRLKAAVHSVAPLQ